MLAEAALVISFAGVGPVELGMTRRAAERAAGKEIEPGLCGPESLGGDRSGIRLLFLDGRVHQVFVDRRRVARTARGVRVGDSLRELRRAYPRALRELELRDSSPRRRFALDQGRRRIRFSIDRDAPRITGISTGWRRSDHPGWRCEET